MVIAPILDPNVRWRRLFLPTGTWVDYWGGGGGGDEGMVLEAGGRGMWVDKWNSPLGRPPVFVKQGADVPAFCSLKGSSGSGSGGGGSSGVCSSTSANAATGGWNSPGASQVRSLAVSFTTTWLGGEQIDVHVVVALLGLFVLVVVVGMMPRYRRVK